MKFLELINKCLLELNYKQVSAFSELIKNDHKKIKTILNILNKEVCRLEGWDFLLKRTTLNLPANTTEIENTVNGRILYLIIEGNSYKYCSDNELYFTGKLKDRTFSSFGNMLLFPEFGEDKQIDIVYYSGNCVKSLQGEEKENLEYGDDESVIPMPFAEQILVYGTCLRMKANTEHFRFLYWQGMYNEALKNLKSKTCAVFRNPPKVSIHR